MSREIMSDLVDYIHSELVNIAMSKEMATVRKAKDMTIKITGTLFKNKVTVVFWREGVDAIFSNEQDAVDYIEADKKLNGDTGLYYISKVVDELLND